MLVSDFDFELPSDLIAQEPPAERGSSRMMRFSRTGPTDIAHLTVADLPGQLHAGDLVVVNNTRVFPARLLGRRVPSGGAVECLLVAKSEPSPADASSEIWEALMHPGQKLKPGAQVRFEGVDGPRLH